MWADAVADPPRARLPCTEIIAIAILLLRLPGGEMFAEAASTTYSV